MAKKDVLFPNGTRILELGSGAGFLGILCARLAQNTDIYLTDLEGSVLDRLRETVELNGLKDAIHVHVAPLDWTDATKDLLKNVNATLILAADTVYDPELVGPLAQTIRAALIGDGSSERLFGTTTPVPTALVASTVRNPDTYFMFEHAIKHARLKIRQAELLQAEWPGGWPVFPSVHDPFTDGHVVLAEITLA